jgi:succinate-semialdehyde dehydrogenase/glutarate-semialdehyde dehydrogenase
VTAVVDQADTPYRTLDPATGRVGDGYPLHDAAEVDSRLDRAFTAWQELRGTTVAERADLLRRLADHFDDHVEEYARLVTAEMGRPIRESRAEIEKCASTCRTIAELGPGWLEPIEVPTEAQRSFTRFEGLGPILGVMPWNYPFFQVIRYFAPAFLAGNSTIVKHAENVPGCGEAVERAFASIGAPDGVLVNLRVDRNDVAAIIADDRVAAVTFTGSVPAGRAVAAQAASVGKKTVLELGGSDPFIVLEDADLDRAVRVAVQARYINAGQSCICGKRFLVHERLLPDFQSAFVAQVEALTVGDPFAEETQIGPMARADLRAALDRQVQQSTSAGATALVGGHSLDGPGFYYAPTVLTDAPADSPARCQELFGPVASLTSFRDDAEALALANATEFGLGASIWTGDAGRAEWFVERVDAGAVFVNDMVRSDPRLSFGGIKASGFGRELGILGTREFTNPKMVWIA